MTPFRSCLISGLAGLLLVFSVPLYAKVYQVAPELLQEVRVNKEAFKTGPSADTAFDLAMSYAYSGQIEKGWATLKKIPDYDKEYSSKVVEKYRPLVKDSPRVWKYQFKLAFGYYFMDQKDKSIECFRKVLDIDPKNVWALAFISLIKGDQGHIDEAIVLAKECIRLEPNAAALHFLLGAGYLKQGNVWGVAQETVSVGRLKAQEAMVYGDY